MKIIGIVIAALLIGFGVRSVWTKTSLLWFLHLEEWWFGEESWEAYRWVAVLLGVLHIAAGLWVLKEVLGP